MLTIIPATIPQEIIDKIFLHLDTSDILRLGEKNVSEYVWLRKKDKTIKEACINKNIIGLRYHIERCMDDIDMCEYALIEAIHSGCLDIIKYLVEDCIVNIHDDNDYALRYSVIYNNIEVVQYLIQQGADIHAGGDIMLTASAENNNIDMLMYLIKQGADIHANDDIILIAMAWHGHLDIIKYCIENGANILAHLDDMLQLSAENGHLCVVEYCIGHSIDLDITSALQISVKSGHLNIVKYLVKQGANIYEDDGYIFKLCVENGHLNILKYFVENGVDTHVLIEANVLHSSIKY
jgi:ankyrin repeat protein